VPKKTLTALLAVIAASGLSQALASPAQDLFNQATRYLGGAYYGYSAAPVQNFTAKYQPALDKACADKGEQCPYEAAVPVLREMVSELADRHTYYMTPEGWADQQRTRAGLGSEKPKIGVSLAEVTGSNDTLISDVVEGGPGHRAGLSRGDRITTLNGRASTEWTNSLEFRQALISAVGEGKPVTLGIRRGGKDIAPLTLTGELIKSAALPSLRTLDSGVAVLRIPNFMAVGLVAQRVHDLVRQAQAQGARGLVLDLRDNNGGAVTEMVATTGAFLAEVGFVQEYKGGSVITQWKDGGIVRGEGAGFYRVNNPALWTGPLVVLINSRSASAPEYVAQFIKDAGRGSVLGEATAGVANTIVQSVSLVDKGALTITVGRALRLNRTPMPEKVTPDLEVKDDLDALATTGRDVLLEAGLQRLLTSNASK
jgi:carboxyl-terminal processing protease